MSTSKQRILSWSALLICWTVSATWASESTATNERHRLYMVDAVSIPVFDVDRSIRFYVSFGLKETRAAVADERWLRISDELTLRLRQLGAPAPHTTIRFTVPTTDFEGVLANLLRVSTPWIDSNGNPGQFSYGADGNRQVFVKDPDGHWFEVRERAQPKP